MESLDNLLCSSSLRNKQWKLWTEKYYTKLMSKLWFESANWAVNVSIFMFKFGIL